MPIRDAVDSSNPESSLIQNRLTVAGFAITTLIFSGTFSLNLYTNIRQLYPDFEPKDFRIAFLHIEVALTLGFIMSVLTLVCFLLSQSLREDEVQWYRSKQWWFSVGQILLYLAFSQALSSSLTEVVFGIGMGSQRLGWMIGLFALPVWWLLLFIGPISYIKRIDLSKTRYGSRLLILVYVAAVLCILAANAWAYTLIDNNGVFSFSGFFKQLMQQLIQPATWYQPWDSE